MSQPFIIHQGAVKQKKKLNNFMYWELVATWAYGKVQDGSKPTSNIIAI
jgi:hypothetical protein